MAAGSVTVIEKRSIFGAKLRWAICGLLFFATTVNYVDRQVLGILKPVLERDLGWSEANYGWVVFTFQLAYGLMMPFAGRAMARLCAGGGGVEHGLHAACTGEYAVPVRPVPVRPGAGRGIELSRRPEDRR